MVPALLAVLVAVACAGLSGWLAVEKGWRPTFWVLAGLLLGPVGVLMCCCERDRAKSNLDRM